jgi:nitrogen fixation NifU-like protein
MEDILQYYYSHPVNNYSISDPTVSCHVGNPVCGDDITVYVLLDNDRIKEFSYDGNCSLITKACASFLADIVQGKTTHEVLHRNLAFLESQGLTVSPRRQRAAVIALLALRNALHHYYQDGHEDDFDTLLDE